METTTADPIDLTSQKIAKLKPLVQEMLALIASSNLPVGNLIPEEEDAYATFSEKVLEMFLKYNINYTDKDMVFQLALQPISKVRDIILPSLAKSMNTSMDVKFGKSFTEITMKDLDDIIKSQVVPEVPVA